MKTFRPKNLGFLLLLYFLSVIAYCNPYDDDLGVCHVGYITYPIEQTLGK